MGAVADPADMIEQLRADFEEMDVDGSGMIDGDELSAMCKEMEESGAPMDVIEECVAMLLEADEDGSGEVSFEEFAELFMAELKGSIGEGPNHSNHSNHSNSFKIGIFPN